MKFVSAVVIALALLPSAPAAAQALLLFDGPTGRTFVGCLNCSRYDSAAVCNRYGTYGSQYNSESIWNRYGTYGSRYSSESPWNRYGEGLRVVDPDGNYYGRMTASRYGADKSRLPLVQALMDAHAEVDDLDELRDLLCE